MLFRSLLTSNGSAWVSSAPALGAMTLISTQTGASVTNISWTSLSGYDKYMLVVQLSNNSTASVYVQTGYGATPTWNTGGNQSGYVSAGSTVNGAYGAALLSGVCINYPGSSGSIAANGVYCIIFIENANSSSRHYINFNGSDTYPQIYTGAGYVFSSGVLTAVRLNGTTLTGTASLYGISS